LLADKFDLDLSKEHPFGKLITRQNNLWKGCLPNNWTYHFHGSHCKFENTITKQILDVTINRGKNYGLFVDSSLFWFIEITKELNYLYEKIETREVLTNCINILEKEQYIFDIGEFGYKSFILNKKENLN